MKIDPLSLGVGLAIGATAYIAVAISLPYLMPPDETTAQISTTF